MRKSVIVALLASSIAMSATAKAGVIGGDTGAFGDGRPCLEMSGIPGLNDLTLTADRAAHDVAPALRAGQRDAGIELTEDCIAANEPALPTLSAPDLLDARVAAGGMAGSIGDWVVPDDDAPLQTSATLPAQGDSRLFSALSHYVVEIEQVDGLGLSGSGVSDTVSDQSDPRLADTDVNLFGVDGRHVEGLLDQSVWRELLISVLEPAIETNDHDSFSFLGIGAFRFEFDRATSSLQLIETTSMTTVSLGGRDPDATEDAGNSNREPGPIGGGSMSTEELITYMAGRLLTSPWLYMCALIAALGVGVIQLRRRLA